MHRLANDNDRRVTGSRYKREGCVTETAAAAASESLHERCPQMDAKRPLNGVPVFIYVADSTTDGSYDVWVQPIAGLVGCQEGHLYERNVLENASLFNQPLHTCHVRQVTVLLFNCYNHKGEPHWKEWCRSADPLAVGGSFVSSEVTCTWKINRCTPKNNASKK